MARKATIHRAQIELSHVDRGVYGDVRVTVARHPSETSERMLARLLAFALCYEESLEFGRGVSTPEEPDAWSRDPDGGIRQWIEVGQPDAQRLVKAARQSARAALFAFGGGVERWRRAQLEGRPLPPNLHVARIDDVFLGALASSLDRTLRWTLTVSEGALFLAQDGATHETVPEQWLGDPLG